MICPNGSRLLILRDAVETVSSGGIVLPDSVKEQRLNKGVVVRVGTDPDLKMKEGCVVIFNEYAGTEVTDENVTYLIIEESDVIAFEG
jgi:chaperonin GroES|tara:strand:- start:118 stop:381 length:264 start_codon:yes stop_codon:yes gene_type:complete